MIDITLTEDQYEELVELRRVELMDEDGEVYIVQLDEDDATDLTDAGSLVTGDVDEEHELRLIVA